MLVILNKYTLISANRNETETNLFFRHSSSSSFERQPIKALLKDVLKESGTTYPHTNED